MAGCILVPKKGKDLFKALKKNFGYKSAVYVYKKVTGQDFINSFKNTLTLDSEGIPSYESVMSNTLVQNYLGTTNLENSVSKKQFKNNMVDVEEAISVAKDYNKNNPTNNNYVAIVEKNGEYLKISLLPKTQANIKKANDQMSAMTLNKRLVEILSPIGLSIGILSDEEVKSGRLGITDFSLVKNIAENYSNIIRVANNLGGYDAISEEVAHLMVGMFKDHSLVVRSLNVLKSNEKALKDILGEQYDTIKDLYQGNIDLVAEEALGKILQDNLLKNTNLNKTPAPSLFKRLIEYIKNIFKQINPDSIKNTIIEVDNNMGEFAKAILKEQLNIDKNKLKNSYREAKFNSLDEEIEKDIQVLKDAIKIEMKRLKIMKYSEAKKYTIQKQKETIDKLMDTVDNGGDPLLGILNYSKTALSAIRLASSNIQNIDNITDTSDKFKMLRNARSFVYSYAPFLDAVNKQIIQSVKAGNKRYSQEFEIEGVKINLFGILEELDRASKQVLRQYSEAAFPLFATFLEPFLGEDIKKSYKEYAGSDLSIEELLKQANSDISLMDSWIDSMANSSDILLQLFDKVAKKSYDNARLQALDYIRKSQALRIEAENAGIKSFEWMFEKDKDGNFGTKYISEINYAQYESDLNKKKKELNEKYGENATGENAKNKIKELRDWKRNHTNPEDRTLPHPEKYKNKEYLNLSDKQKDILKKYIKLKKELDELIDNNNDRTIQIRKSTAERIAGSLNITSPIEAWNNIKEGIVSSFKDRSDDVELFGDAKVSAGIQDFTGREFMTIPVLGIVPLDNKNEISTDVFRSLNIYAYSATLKHNLEKVIDPLEVGRTIVEEDRKVLQTKGGKSVVEKGKEGNITWVNKITKPQGSSNIVNKLNNFFESRLYLRYLKDHGNIGSLNINKTVGTALSISSLARLGFNYLSNLSNAINGIAMTNIEAAAQQFFKAKHLLKADKIYASLVPKLMSDNAKMSRQKNNKLSLFSEFFNTKQDFDQVVQDDKIAALIKRFFGSNIAMMMQTGGDHWLYNRVAIAMCLGEEVEVPNKGKMSLWEALEIVEDSPGVKKMILPEGTLDKNGNSFDVFEFANKIHEVNHTLFGIYNNEDKSSAHGVAGLRLILHYRNWMKALYSRRFRPSFYSTTLGEMEGFYITFFGFLKDITVGKQNIIEAWNNLTPNEIYNMRRAITELLQLLGVGLLATFVFKGPGDDDEDESLLFKWGNYFTHRMLHELGTLTPSFLFIEENIKTIKNPIPITRDLDDIGKLLVSLLTPSAYTEEMQSGPYKGMSRVERNLYSAPIPGLSWYKNIDKFFDDVDNSAKFYSGAYR